MALPIVTRPDWFRLLRLASFVLAATSGLGLLFQAIKLLWQKTKWFLWKSAVPSSSEDKDEAIVLASLGAVKATSSIAAEVAKLSRVLLELQSEGRHHAFNIARYLQAQSLKLTETERIARGITKEMGNSKQLSAMNDEPRKTIDPSTKTHIAQSPTFLEIMAMLERGETPPGIKTINDKPPIPNQRPSLSRLAPKPKPWEKAQKPKSYVQHIT